MGSATNAGAVAFPACTGGTNTATHFGIGTDSSGAGNLVFSSPLDASLAISSGITPQFSAGELAVALTGEMEDAFILLVLSHLLENGLVANIGDATGLRGSSVAGNFYISLHTGDPAGGNQTTSECDYTSYARVAVTREAASWDVA